MYLTFEIRRMNIKGRLQYQRKLYDILILYIFLSSRWLVSRYIYYMYLIEKKHYLRENKVMVSIAYRWYKNNTCMRAHVFCIILQLLKDKRKEGMKNKQMLTVLHNNNYTTFKVHTLLRISNWNMSSKVLSTVPFLISGCSESINGPSWEETSICQHEMLTQKNSFDKDSGAEK